MPNRILKDSICTSDSLAGLTDFQEAFFYRLIVNCDDFGRMDGRPAILKARLYPLRERLTLKEIESALRALATVGCVEVYEVDGKPFLRLPSWEVHQQIRAKKSKYPAPVGPCNQMISSDSKCPRNPIQSESNPNPNPNPTAQDAREADFDLFWSAYPRKDSKKEAAKAFKKVKVSLDVLLAAIERQKHSKQWTKGNGEFIPYAASWLNQERWNDEMTGGEHGGSGERIGTAEENAERKRNAGTWL